MTRVCNESRFMYEGGQRRYRRRNWLGKYCMNGVTGREAS